MSGEKNYNTYNLIMTITTIIFAITSLITVAISLSAWKDERESVRPYLTFNNSPEVYISESGQVGFTFNFKNVGEHPAASLYCQTIIVDCDLDTQPLHKDQLSLVNFIPQNTAAKLEIKINEEQHQSDFRNILQHYIVINLKYTDPVLDKQHEQILYLRWAGVSEGRVLPLFHASREDKSRILEYLGSS